MSAAAEPELTLRLAGTSRARARHADRISELAARTDLATLEVSLRDQGLLSLIGARLADGQPISAGFAAAVREYAERARRIGAYQQLLTVQLSEALAAAGIRALPLKGPLMAERLYGDSGARPSADIDLLVPLAGLAAAVDVLGRFGYRRHRLLPLSSANPPVLHERMVHPSGLPAVELHWRVHWSEERFSAQMLERARMGPDGCLVADPADELGLLLLVYARDGFAGLRLAADLAAWWDRYGELPEAERPDLGRIAAIARDQPPLARSLSTALVLADRLVGVPADRVLPARFLAGASGLALRLGNWSLEGSRHQIEANIRLVDWALTPPLGWREVVRRQFSLLPREQVLDDPSPTRGAGAVAGHGLRVVGRFAVAAAVLLRRRTWSPRLEPAGLSRGAGWPATPPAGT